jgi:ribosomal protein S18 acetylase RimI-like enzyme
MKRSSVIIYLLTFIVCGGIATGIFFYYYQSYYPPIQILDFYAPRDTAPIQQLIETNWHWLISSEDFSVDRMLTYKTPFQHDARYFGTLLIKTLYVDHQFAGFISYYKKNASKGQIFLLAIEPIFRGHNYGLMLVNYAVQDLANQGVSTIKLVTRTTNIPAQSLYTRAGFSKVGITHDGKFIFQKRLPSILRQ